ncbi:serine/threonine-protein kinase [Modestobacter roseus]|uniref:serine/threonine-protein kinase n=1 Tax=Modestobacter roseus TaxID=1181884 RepID=UPI001FB84CF4|nr:serine/threonine-protein kinase [Modestobacter roseus]
MVEPTRSTLGDRYELQALLATGGMGQVWRAEDTLLGRTVAIKVLRSEYTGDPLFLARFRAEAQHTAALSHPNITAVYDYGEEPAIDGSGEHLAYLVMELIDGESLAAVLARDGALPPTRVLEVLRQTASALGSAHAAGVVHRDVKPGNVLLRADGTVAITDFGIASSAGSVPLTKTGQVIGTASYLSPEQASGAHATAASDVYALGMVGYELLTGQRAFDGDNSVTIALRHLRDTPEPLPDDVPAGVRTLVERALVKDPAQRFPDGDAFAAAIDDVLAGRLLTPVERTDTQSFWLLPDAAALAGASTADGTVRRPAPAAQGRLGRVLVPVVALLAGAGLAAVVLQGVAPDATGTTEAAAQGLGATTATASPAELTLDDDDYLDRPVEAVQRQLEALGLVVQTQAVATDSVDAGLVVDVAPLGGRLERGGEVLVSYAVAPEADSSPTPRQRTTVDTVRAPVPRAPVSIAPPATTPAPSPTPQPAPTTEPDETSVAPDPTDGSESSAPVIDPGGSGTPTSPGGGAAPTTGTGSTAPVTGSGQGSGNGQGNGTGQGNGSGSGRGTAGARAARPADLPAQAAGVRRAVRCSSRHPVAAARATRPGVGSGPPSRTPTAPAATAASSSRSPPERTAATASTAASTTATRAGCPAPATGPQDSPSAATASTAAAASQPLVTAGGRAPARRRRRRRPARR